MNDFRWSELHGTANNDRNYDTIIRTLGAGVPRALTDTHTDTYRIEWHLYIHTFTHIIPILYCT